MALGATPIVAFAYFSMTSSCSAPLEGLLEEGGTLAWLPFPSFATSKEVSTLELVELGARIQESSIHSLLF